jgi:methylase of polypeptide subunit release factors
VNRVNQSLSETIRPKKLRVLDLCTGSGCIPLLFHHLFYSNPSNRNTTLESTGVDLFKTALELANDNLVAQRKSQRQNSGQEATCRSSLQDMKFVKADVLHNQVEGTSGDLSVEEALQKRRPSSGPPIVDILISNPPYISHKDFRATTARSVRRYEPRMALLGTFSPSQSNDELDGDRFYPPIMTLAQRLDARMVLCEVGNLDQAVRVAALLVNQRIWEDIEIWRDDPADPHETVMDIADCSVKVRGSGNGRSVFARRAWRNKGWPCS